MFRWSLLVVVLFSLLAPLAAVTLRPPRCPPIRLPLAPARDAAPRFGQLMPCSSRVASNAFKTAIDGLELLQPANLGTRG